MKQSEINKLTKEGYIQVLITIQVQGNDEAGVDKTTRKQIDEILEIGKEISAKIVSPQKIDKEIKWFSQYAEIEILLEDPDRVFDIILDYMVSSVEIIAPKEFTINTQTHQDRLNDLIIKMRESEKFILGLAAQKKVLEAEIQNQKTKQQ
jgi:predicted  nucleic acid-binding Zn-ribbon protein